MFLLVHFYGAVEISSRDFVPYHNYLLQLTLNFDDLTSCRSCIGCTLIIPESLQYSHGWIETDTVRGIDKRKLHILEQQHQPQLLM